MDLGFGKCGEETWLSEVAASRSLFVRLSLLSLAFSSVRTPVHTFLRTHLRSPTMSIMLRPALNRSSAIALRRATTPACCRNFTSSTWLLSPQPSLKLHEELQRSFEPHGRGASLLRTGFLPGREPSLLTHSSSSVDGHPAVSSPTLPATTNASPSDAAPNAATTEWRLSRPHEDWVLAHPVYTQEELDAIQIVERPPENMTDRLAKWMVKAARAGFDLVTGYKVRCRVLWRLLLKVGPRAHPFSTSRSIRTRTQLARRPRRRAKRTWYAPSPRCTDFRGPTTDCFFFCADVSRSPSCKRRDT